MFVRGLHAPGAFGRGPVRNRLRIGRPVPGQPREPRRMDRVVEPVVCSMARPAARLRLQPTAGQARGDSRSRRHHDGAVQLLPHDHGSFRGKAVGPDPSRDPRCVLLEHDELLRRLDDRTPLRIARTALADAAGVDQRLIGGRRPLSRALRAHCRRQDSRREMDHRLDTRRGNRNGGLLRHRGLGVPTAPFRIDDSELARRGRHPLGLPVRPRVR